MNTKGLMSRRKQVGNLLMELGFTLAALGALAATIMGGLGAIEQSRLASERRHHMERANQALKTFVLRSNRLPCPDLTGNGMEGDAAGECSDTARVGRLPYASLNLLAPANGAFLKYGVSRTSSTSDLVKAGSPATSKYSFSSFVIAAGAASIAVASANEPFVAGRGEDGRLSNCGAPALRPAYALMFVTPDMPMASLCFNETPVLQVDVTYMRHEELLGWAASNLR